LIFITSDHGYHLGQNGLALDKRLPYETDIRVPFVVAGPGIAKGVQNNAPILNIDMFPTFLDIAGVPIPEDIDGVSIMSLLSNSSVPRQEFLVEYHGEHNDGGYNATDPTNCSIPLTQLNCYVETQYDTLPLWQEDIPFCSCQDSTNNTYSCVRILNQTLNWQYCEFDGGFIEFYDVNADPWQTKNGIGNLSIANQQDLHQKLQELKICSGLSCQTESN